MKVKVVTQTLQRVTGTTQYAAGEVISQTAPLSLKFEGMSQFDGGGFEIRSALMMSSANQATKPDLELWLFSADVVVPADNSAFVPTDAEMATLVGVIPFPVASFKVANAGSGADGNISQNVFNVSLSGNSNTLYGVLVVRNTYTPVDSEIFTAKLQVLHDHQGH